MTAREPSPTFPSSSHDGDDDDDGCEISLSAWLAGGGFVLFWQRRLKQRGVRQRFLVVLSC